ncbi:MAG: hypothetical protein LBO62_07510 [Endomicrobium sp.]|jgi:hypothetical protein|nr:hypothetical protein [Endomicrobium sp.]
MFVKIRGYKVGVHGEGAFIVNTDNVKSIEVLGDVKILYLSGDNYGITVRGEDFDKLYAFLNPEDFTGGI